MFKLSIEEAPDIDCAKVVSAFLLLKSLDIREIKLTDPAYTWIIRLKSLEEHNFWASYILNKLPKSLREDNSHNVIRVGSSSIVVCGELPLPPVDLSRVSIHHEPSSELSIE